MCVDEDDSPSSKTTKPKIQNPATGKGQKTPVLNTDALLRSDLQNFRDFVTVTALDLI